MFGGFDLNLGDFNKTFSDLTSTLPSITLNDILEAGGDSSADASTTLFFNPVDNAPSAITPKKSDLDYEVTFHIEFFFNFSISFYFSHRRRTTIKILLEKKTTLIVLMVK